MANLGAIVGPSGSGKSTSLGKNEKIGIKGLNPKETFIINLVGKPLPILGYRKHYTKFINPKETPTGNLYVPNKGGTKTLAEKAAQIIQYINDSRPEIKHIVLEDYQYFMGFEVMKTMKEKGFDKFLKIAAEGFIPVETAQNCDRDDLNIFFLTHDEETGEDGSKTRKLKTAGKLVDNAITLEGLFTMILYTQISTNTDETGKKTIAYNFVTQNDGTTTAKSPIGMFDSLLIPNDLGYVVDKMNEYYN